jgi:predicted nucleic acid-binding protein
LILVDSSVWIDFLSSSPGPAGTELNRLISASEPFALTGLVLAEVSQGLRYNVAEIEEFLLQWEVLEPRISTYREAAGLFRLARSRGIAATTVDTVLAATALEHKAALFTIDVGLKRIAGLGGITLHFA